MRDGTRIPACNDSNPGRLTMTAICVQYIELSSESRWTENSAVPPGKEWHMHEQQRRVFGRRGTPS